MILNEEQIEEAIEYIRNQLQAHDADLEEVIQLSEKCRAVIGFTLTVKKEGGKIFPEIRMRLPRGSIQTATFLHDAQIPLPIENFHLKHAK